MRVPKSHTEFILGFYNILLTQDMVRQYGTLDFGHDLVKISNRVANEGISFATKTLPKLGKAIDSALCLGVFTCPIGFKKAKGTAYPLMFNGMLKRVFNCDGSVKTKPCVSAVKDLRQICYLFYKYELGYDQETIDQFFASFKKTDATLGGSHEEYCYTNHLALPCETDRNVLSCANTLLRELLEGIDLDKAIPAHGPGAVASGEKNWEKMKFRVHYECIHQVFPYYKFFASNAMDLAANVKAYWSRDRVPSGIAKCVLVPKDSRGPRLISMEPLEFQWVQQGIRKCIYAHVENHQLTRGHVSFTDQKINGDHALAGSVSGDSVTLDMKEASNRIACWLTDDLFVGTPIHSSINATRTEATELPSAEVLLMNMFAPMGSALCFPIMSLVHWSLCVATLNVIDKVPIKSALKSVYVYGDDIIIKGQNHISLIKQFPRFGLMFNEGKCCTQGIFRESCGTDALLGEVVTPLKIKKVMPSTRRDAAQYPSYITYINTLWKDAYYSSSLWLENIVTEVYGPVPHVMKDSDTPGFYSERHVGSSNAASFKQRWNTKFQRDEHKCLRLVSEKHYNDLDRSEYQRKLVTKSDDFVAGVYTVPHRVKLKKRWSSSLAGTEPTSYTVEGGWVKP